jgi:4-hydroxy-2-oxoheptanedioate aldolase
VTPFAARLRAGERLLAVLVPPPAAALVEACAHAGFDVVVLDAEHGPGELAPLEADLRAARAAGIAALVRVPAAADPLVLRVLDAGATGIVVPHVASAEGARAAVAAAHYPPAGRRSLATGTTAGRQGLAPLDEHLARARAETVVVVQIEDAEAVEQAEEIAATPGVDAIFPGPGDLALDLGAPGEDALAEALELIAAAVAAAPPALVAVALDEADAQDAYVRGAGLVVVYAPVVVARRLQAFAAGVRSP